MSEKPSSIVRGVTGIIHDNDDVLRKLSGVLMPRGQRQQTAAPRIDAIEQQLQTKTNRQRSQQNVDENNTYQIRGSQAEDARGIAGKQVQDIRHQALDHGTGKKRVPFYAGNSE
jgi:hypothetical protein